MIKRIVKMTFVVGKEDDFLDIFNASKEKIRNFEGVSHLELLRDKIHLNVFFTYSFWESEAALEKYRHSALFKDTWAKTKLLFAEEPKAWSTEVISVV